MTRFAALARHPVAIAGVVLATVSASFFIVAVVGTLAGLFANPYGGLIVFIAVPIGLVLGLLLIPLGMWLERRRERRDPTHRDWPVLDFRHASVRRVALAILALTVVNLAILMLATHGALRAMESPTFCGQACHVPMQPQYVAWQAGPHARTACVKCHIGEGAAAFVHAKLAGVRQLAHVFTDSYARPTPPGAEMPPGAQAETCRGCHQPDRHADDELRVIRAYADDETSQESATTLQMRVDAIHRHVEPSRRIEYVTTDATNETIPYVQVTAADGTVREYITPGTTPEAIRAGTRRTMDCVDCHNTVGHPIAATPEQAVDGAIAAGALSRQLPFARREAVRLLTATYDSDATAASTIDRELRGFYGSKGSDIDERQVARTVAALQALYRRHVFPAMKVTFGSYPSQQGHTTATGCFRCHDGGHADKAGAVIGADCESCHIQIVAPQ